MSNLDVTASRFAKSVALGALIAGCTACTSGPEIIDTPPPPTWHEDVRPIFEQTCMSCHTEDGGITGIPLTTYADAQIWRDRIAATVSSGTMPPWRADDGCNTYENDFSLSDTDVDTIVRWVDGDTPEGDIANAAATQSPWIPPALERVDAELLMPDTFTPTADPDDYRCFILDWDETETTWLTGYNFRPGNTNIVHHVIPFIVPPADAQSFRDLDEAEDGLGYTCYGGPGGDIDSLIDARWLGAWAPGGGASVMPDGYGLEIEPGSIMVMQVHYNVGPNNEEFDLSSVEIQLERTELKGAEVQPWTEISWVLGMGMDIPPNSTDVSHTFSYVNENEYPLALHNAALHMHELGRSATFKVIHADGTESCLLNDSQWDFNWQRSYELTEPVLWGPGDTIELTCTWDNNTDEVVRWGDGTGDEMCLAVTLLTWD